MKLINLAHSPYAARVRLLAYAKGIELELVAPEGLSTPQFKQFNILGKVPVLDTGEQLIPESIVIMDYLEDICPEPSSAARALTASSVISEVAPVPIRRTFWPL